MKYRIKQTKSGRYYVQRRKWYWIFDDRLHKSGRWIGWGTYTIWRCLEDAESSLQQAMKEPDRPTTYFHVDKTIYETTDEEGFGA